MKRIWLTLVAAGMLAIAAFAPVSAQDQVTLDLDDVDDSGVAGNVRIESENGESTVTILLTEGLEDESVHPVHIHEGTCDDLGDVAYPLNNIEDGSSETTIDVDLSELRTGDFAINAHESEENISTFIACADIPAAVGGDVEGDDGEGDDGTSEEDDATDDDEASEDDGTSEDDGNGDEGSMDESEDDATDETEDDATDESDDDAAEDDGSMEDGDEGADDSGDDAAEDEASDDSDDQADEDDAAEDDGEDEEQEEVAPETGSSSGADPDTVAMTLMLLAGGGLVGGMLLRRRATQVQGS